MKHLILLINCLLFIACSLPCSAIETEPDINTILMRSTFKIQGDNNTLGTVFILGQPQTKNRGAKFILVTAAHVLNEISGDFATIFLRKNNRNNYTKYPYRIKIRDGKKNYYKTNNNVDVAVMYVALPKEIDILLASTEILADDAAIEKFEIYPGREVKILGYPFGVESNKWGFPILRSGDISSYPLTPIAVKLRSIRFKLRSNYHLPIWLMT